MTASGTRTVRFERSVAIRRSTLYERNMDRISPKGYRENVQLGAVLKREGVFRSDIQDSVDRSRRPLGAR